MDRFLAAVAYLDGERPSLVMTRGYYTRAVLVAWNGLLLLEYQWLVHTPGRKGPYPTLRELVAHTPFRR